MSREQLDRLLAYAKEHPEPTRGTWFAFRQREGISRDSLYHWRKKLGLVPTIALDITQAQSKVRAVT